MKTFDTDTKNGYNVCLMLNMTRFVIFWQTIPLNAFSFRFTVCLLCSFSHSVATLFSEKKDEEKPQKKRYQFSHVSQNARFECVNVEF